MKISIVQTNVDAGRQAALRGAEHIRQALRDKGAARLILATGASQFEVLKALVACEDIDWSKCTVFHLDEYVGLPRSHRASFVNYLNARFVGLVPGLGHFEAIDGESDDVEAEITRLNETLSKAPIDVAFVGIGENGHLAFNDPPADFETTVPFLRVTLDEPCRRQQVNEGWFEAITDVPAEALTMSIRQIMAAKAIICTVQDQRKARAVKNAVEGPVSNLCPASILQEHANTTLILDEAAATELSSGACNG